MLSFTQKSFALFSTIALLAACDGGNKEAAQVPSSSTPAVSQDKTYKVAMNADFAPFESTGSDGKVQGFDVDLMNAIAKEEGFKIEYRDQPWDGLFATLKSGDNDILISAITITPERRETMAFSNPYFEVKQVILVPKGQHITSVQDLKQLTRIGVVTGNTADIAATKILGTEAANQKVARFENLALVIKELESGGIQAMISDSAVVGNYVKLHPNQGFTIVEVPDFEKEEYGIALRPDETELLKRINDGLAKIRANGEYDRIYHQYFAQ